MGSYFFDVAEQEANVAEATVPGKPGSHLEPLYLRGMMIMMYTS